MCRISGVFYRHTADFRPLFSMMTHQKKGGPDAFGTWNDDVCGLGHNRLSILDLSDAGWQPMESENWVITYNGEIYNHLELRKRIERQWAGHSDTETLVHYIEVYGIEKTVSDIEGMYAFAAYNKVSKDLFLVTDQLSIKPLYYAVSGDAFIFASSIAAIAIQLPKLKIDRQALIDYLALGSTYEPLFQGIKKLHPGRILRVNRDLNMTESFSYPFGHRRTYTESECLEVLEASIESVRLSDVPLFIFLSGGIDSSVVAGVLSGVNAVHLASPEERYAKQVSERFNIPISFIDPSEESAEACLKDYVWQSGDCSMAALIPYITSKHAARFGKVAISANGADELFFGYNRTGVNTTDEQINHIFRKHFYQQSTWRDRASANSRMLELESYVSYDLNKTLDFASMCFGLEVRVPFLNREVIKAAMWLPCAQHVTKEYGNKAILKKWLKAKGFDNKFLMRPKEGFSLHHEPADYSMLKEKGLKLLKNEFGIDLPIRSTDRDHRYFEASAACFHAWYSVWSDHLS